MQPKELVVAGDEVDMLGVRWCRADVQAWFRALPVAVFVKDADGRYLAASDAFAAFAGVASAGDVVGRTDEDLPWAAMVARVRSLDDTARNDGTARFEIPEPWSDRPDAGLATMHLVRVPSDGGYGVLGLAVRPSDAVSSDDTLTAGTVRAFVHASPVAHVVTGLDGTLVARNHAYHRLFDHAPSEFTDPDDWWSAVYPDPEGRASVRDAWRTRMDAIQRDGHCPPLESTIVRGDGESRYVRARIVAIANILLVSYEDLTELRVAEARNRALIDHVSDAVFLLRGHRVVEANPAALAFFDAPREVFVGAHPADFSPPTQPDGRPSREAADDAIEQAVAEGTAEFSWRHRTRKGAVRSAVVRLRSVPTLGEGSVLAMVRDQTELEDRRRRMRLLAAIVDESPVSHVLVDGRGRIVECNTASEDLLRAASDRIVGTPLRDLVHLPADARATADEGWSGLTRARALDGTELDVRVRIRSVYVDDPERPLCVVSMTDETVALARERELARARTHDRLTGLSNRARALDELDTLLDASAGHSMRLLVALVGVDRLAWINERHGHMAGDAVLVEAAQRLRVALPGAKLVARYGGDEFLVALTRMPSRDAAATYLDNALHFFARPMTLSGRPEIVTVSAACWFAPEAGTTASTIAHRLEDALLVAKRRGRDTVVHVDDVQRDESDDHLGEALRHAVAAGDVRPHYQPVIDVVSGRMVGVEALARWTLNGLDVSPDRFIAIAESLGLVHAITLHMLRAAIEDIARIADTLDTRLSVAVNLSARDVSRPILAAEVESILAAHGTSRVSLVVELTESQYVEDEAAARAALQRLRDVGVRVALDDFGTGWSSLVSLRHLPIDTLKVDRLFVRGLPDEPGDVAILRSVHALAGALGMDVIAEGVETEAQMLWLRDEAPCLAQGWFYAPAMPADELLEWARHRC